MKDYSNHFANMNNKMLAMPMYTVNKRKVDKICRRLSDLNICVATVIDKDRNIIYQSKLPS
ncbi:MAG: hypothetical protein IJX38_00225 [Clostridia bacterium]|nr:hypothetical protein [Clostridia bacterium]